MKGIAEVSNFLVAYDYANAWHRAYCLECEWHAYSLMLHELAEKMAEHYRTHYVRNGSLVT